MGSRTRFTGRYCGVHQDSSGALILTIDAATSELGRMVLLLGYLVPTSRPFRILLARDDGGLNAVVKLRSWELTAEGHPRVQLQIMDRIELFPLNDLYRKTVVVDVREVGDELADDDPGDGITDGLMRQPGRGDAVAVQSKPARKIRTLEG